VLRGHNELAGLALGKFYSDNRVLERNFFWVAITA
jgi:hypothetical protein